MPGFEGSVAVKIVEQQLNGSIAELFDSFEETPLAAASLGQVCGCVCAEWSHASHCFVGHRSPCHRCAQVHPHPTILTSLFPALYFCIFVVVSQVHRAVLKGEEVVVKVQRQGLRRLFQKDLKILKVLALLADRLDPKVGIGTRWWWWWW